MGTEAGVLIGIGFGAASMYLMDLDRGRDRRALLREKTASAYRHVPMSGDRSRSDLTYRAHGFITKKSIVPHEPADDDQLVARGAKIGWLVSHPRAVEVIAP